MVKGIATEVALECGQSHPGFQHTQQYNCILIMDGGIDGAHTHQVAALVVDVDGGGLSHRGIVSTAIDMGDTAALDLQIGLREFGGFQLCSTGSYFLLANFSDISDSGRLSFTSGLGTVGIVAIAATEQTADSQHLGVTGHRNRVRRFTCCYRCFSTGTGAYKGLPGIVDVVMSLVFIIFIFLDVLQFCRNRCCNCSLSNRS